MDCGFESHFRYQDGRLPIRGRNVMTALDYPNQHLLFYFMWEYEMKTKYLHLRRVHPTTMHPQTGEFRRSDLETKGGTTIAYTIDDAFYVIAYAIARCNNKDVYCKHTGRVKAEGRLRSPKYCVLTERIPEKEFIAQKQFEFLN